MKNPNKWPHILNKNSMIIMIISFLNACGTSEQGTPNPCSNDLLFKDKEITGSFEKLRYFGTFCQNLSDIPGPARAVLTIETSSEGTSEINVKARKINETTFEIELPSSLTGFIYTLTRPTDGSRIPSRIRTSQEAVMGIRG